MARKTGTVGHGKEVHYLGVYGSYPVCGSGQCSVGTRRHYSTRITMQPVTCEKCLKLPPQTFQERISDEYAEQIEEHAQAQRDYQRWLKRQRIS